MRRPNSNSTTRLTMKYGTPNSFIRTANVWPFAVIRSGARRTSPTDPEPSIRACWRGSVRIANTTSGGASMVMVPEICWSVTGRPYAHGPRRAPGVFLPLVRSALDRGEAQRHPGEAALADGETLGDLLQGLRRGGLGLGEHDRRTGVAGLAQPGVERD